MRFHLLVQLRAGGSQLSSAEREAGRVSWSAVPNQYALSLGFGGSSPDSVLARLASGITTAVRKARQTVTAGLQLPAAFKALFLAFMRQVGTEARPLSLLSVEWY